MMRSPSHLLKEVLLVDDHSSIQDFTNLGTVEIFPIPALGYLLDDHSSLQDFPSLGTVEIFPIPALGPPAG
jgi:hypothetical protein